MHIHGLEKESWLARLAKRCACKRELPAERSRYSCDGPHPMLLGRRGACETTVAQKGGWIEALAL